MNGRTQRDDQSKQRTRARSILALTAILINASGIVKLHNMAMRNSHLLYKRNLAYIDLPPPKTQKYLTVGWPHQVDDPNHAASVTLMEAFSASWWTSISNFLRFEKIEEVSASCESAAFDMYIANDGKVRMTTDWLDLAVEHMSKWWKLIEHNGPALDRVVNILTRYTKARRIFDDSTSDVPQETLVVIAYAPYAQTELTKWSLAATLSSYISVGMGRIVVSGRLPEDEKLVLEAFDIVKKQFQLNNQTELSFCLAYNEVIEDGTFAVPRNALKKLRHVLLGNASKDEIQCWLGGETSTTSIVKNLEEQKDEEDEGAKFKWRYISLTEPDILLTARPSSLEALGKKLKDGYVLAPHRLQPIPHGSDFKGLDIENDTDCIIPAASPFERVHEVDSNEMSCCDAGQFNIPMKAFEPYDNFWWMSGFPNVNGLKVNHTNPIESAHKHLLLYPLTRLTTGTGVVFVGSEHGKLCHPQHGVGVC